MAVRRGLRIEKDVYLRGGTLCCCPVVAGGAGSGAGRGQGWCLAVVLPHFGGIFWCGHKPLHHSGGVLHCAGARAALHLLLFLRAWGGSFFFGVPMLPGPLFHPLDPVPWP